MSITLQEIEQIAMLARLELGEREKKMYAKQLSAVLDYMKILNEVDVADVEETCQVTGLEDVVREDEVSECDEATKDDLVRLFSEKKDNLLKVKGVF